MFNKSSFLHECIWLSNPMRCQSSFLSSHWQRAALRGAQWPKERTFHGIMQKEFVGVCTFSPGGTWQAVAAPGRAGQPGWAVCAAAQASAPCTRPDVSQGVLHPSEDSCLWGDTPPQRLHAFWKSIPLAQCSTLVMKTNFQILGRIIQPRTLGLVIPYWTSMWQLLFWISSCDLGLASRHWRKCAPPCPPRVLLTLQTV